MLTVEPYRTEGPHEGEDAYTLASVGVQILVDVADAVPFRELTARAWTGHPYDSTEREDIWACIWVERLVRY